MVQVFVSHSSRDSWLVKPIADNLRIIGLQPYLAELDTPNPLSLQDKLTAAVQGSTAVILILSRNVVNNPETRDFINWEIATARAYKKPVYAFVEQSVEVPILMSQIMVYHTFDPFSQESLNEAMKRVVGVGSQLKEQEDKARAAALVIMLFLGIGFLGALSSGK
jgi:hypothetical protein